MARRTRHNSGCLTDCVARLLNRHPETVPFFLSRGEGWLRCFKRYMRKHGLGLRWCDFDKELLKPDNIAIVVYKHGPRGYHATLWLGPKLFYDPNGKKRPKGELWAMWMPYVLNKKKAPKGLLRQVK